MDAKSTCCRSIDNSIQFKQFNATHNRVPAADGSEEVADDPVLVVREATVLYVWPQIVEPPQPAALAAPLETCDAICSDIYFVASYSCYVALVEREE